MSVVPLRWQGAARTARLCAKVEERTRDWLAGWSLAGGEGMQVEACAQVPRATRPEVWMARASGGRLFVHGPAAFFELLGVRLAGVSSGFDALQALDAKTLAAGIGQRAFEDWMRAVIGTAVHVERVDRGEIGQALSEHHGAVHLECTVQGLRCEIDLDAGLCDTLVPPERTPQGTLRPLRNALGTQTVTLDVVLDLGHAALADTLALAPGDIVKTTALLASVVRLQAVGGRTIATGALAAADAHRALRISHPISTRD